MIRGIYSAAANMLAGLARVEMVSNNIANLGTPGYKEDTTVSQSAQGLLLSRLDGGGAERIGALGQGVGLGPPQLRLDQGPLRETGNPLDLALEDPGFFAVQTQDGVRYTRAGAFLRDSGGQLATPFGYPVVGENGPIQLPEGEVLVLPNGTIRVDGEQVAQLQIVDFPNAARLTKIGANLFEPTPESGAAVETAARVRQGYLEEANVDPAQAMVDLMAAMRSYEMSQRMAQLQDEMLGKAVTEVGRIA